MTTREEASVLAQNAKLLEECFDMGVKQLVCCIHCNLWKLVTIL